MPINQKEKDIVKVYLDRLSITLCDSKSGLEILLKTTEYLDDLKRNVSADYFYSVINMANDYCILSLSKIWEERKQSNLNTIPNLLNYLHSNSSKLVEDNERKYLLAKIDEVRKWIDNNETLIGILINHRDNDTSHLMKNELSMNEKNQVYQTLTLLQNKAGSIINEVSFIIFNKSYENTYVNMYDLDWLRNLKIVDS